MEFVIPVLKHALDLINDSKEDIKKDHVKIQASTSVTIINESDTNLSHDHNHHHHHHHDHDHDHSKSNSNLESAKVESLFYESFHFLQKSYSSSFF